MNSIPGRLTASQQVRTPAPEGARIRRVGVIFPGDPSLRSTWSGTPFGVLSGLSATGIEAVPLNADPPERIKAAVLAAMSLPYLRPDRDVKAAIRRAREATRASVEFQRLATLVAPRRIRDAGPLDGIIQIGTGYLLPRGIRTVTFEDMTVPQGRANPYVGWDLISDRAYERRVALQRRAYAQAEAVCLTSRWAARSVIEHYGVDPSRVHVVGVGQNHQAPAGPERDWRTPHFLFVGLDWKRKNGDALLWAFDKLRVSFPDATLDLVGGHPSVDQPGVTGHGVLTLGDTAQREKVERLFADATCFVMPSLIEASAIAYVEAAAAGLPSIGSSTGGSDYLIGDGGLVVDPLDRNALLGAMQKLSDARTAKRLGEIARRRSDLFTWPKVGERLLRALAGEPATPLDQLD